mgnify:CR=1 FL=1
MPNKKPIQIKTIDLDIVCEAKKVMVYNQPMEVIGYCFYNPVAIKNFILDNRLYNVYICWCGEIEHWWLDDINDESAYKYP